MKKGTGLKLVALVLAVCVLLSLGGWLWFRQRQGQSQTASSGQPATVLKVEVFDRALPGGSNPTNNHWTRWINEQMMKRHNIQVEFVSVPRSEEIQQLNVLMAGGNAPILSLLIPKVLPIIITSKAGLPI